MTAATAEAPATTELVKQDRLVSMQPAAMTPVPSPSELAVLTKIANTVAKSRIVDKVKSAEQAFAIMLAGRELGVGPMQSLREIDVIEGKLSLTAQAALGRVHKLRLGIARIIESTETRCVMFFQRFDDGNNQLTVTWTIEQAEAAGLLVSRNNKPKSNWKNFPRAMLMARTAMEGVRAVFPDAFSGVYCHDEIERDDEEIIDAEFEDATPAGFGAYASNSEATNEAPQDTSTSVAQSGAADEGQGPRITEPGQANPNVDSPPPPQQPAGNPPPQEQSTPTASEVPPITEKQSRAINCIVRHLNPNITTDTIAQSHWRDRLKSQFGVEKLAGLNEPQAQALLRSLVQECCSRDGSLNMTGLTDREFSELGITFPLTDGSDPKAGPAGTPATSNDQPPSETDSGDSASTTNDSN